MKKELKLKEKELEMWLKLKELCSQLSLLSKKF